MQKDQRGFTLLEVLIALAILAGGLLVIFQGNIMNIRSSWEAYLLSTAAMMARAQSPGAFFRLS